MSGLYAALPKLWKAKEDRQDSVVQMDTVGKDAPVLGTNSVHATNQNCTSLSGDCGMVCHLPMLPFRCPQGTAVRGTDGFPLQCLLLGRTRWDDGSAAAGGRYVIGMDNEARLITLKRGGGSEEGFPVGGRQRFLRGPGANWETETDQAKYIRMWGLVGLTSPH